MKNRKSESNYWQQWYKQNEVRLFNYAQKMGTETVIERRPNLWYV